jgi:hypothetical protein
MVFVIFEKNLMEIIFKASSDFNGGQVLIGILILLALFGAGRSKTRKAQCRLYNWRGYRKLCNQYGDVPIVILLKSPKIILKR